MAKGEIIGRGAQWRLLALLLGVVVFAVDTLTPPDIEFAPLYALVLLLADRARPGWRIWFWTAGCIAAASISFGVLFDPHDTPQNVARFAIGIATLVSTGFLLSRRSTALATVEQQSRALDVAPTAIIVREKSGRIVLWNSAAERLYGWPRKEAIGRDAFLLLGGRLPRDCEEIEAELERDGRWSGEGSHQRRDGVAFPVLAAWTLIGEGERAFVVESNVDADAQRAADATRLSEQRYRKIFDTLAVAIWEHDLRPVKAATEALRAQGVTDVRRYVAEHPEFVKEVRRTVRITDVNETAVRMMGVASKAEFFSRLADFLPEDDPSFEHCIIAIDENRPAFVSETRVRAATGEMIPIIIVLSFPPNEGLDRISGSILDLRERLKLQATVERARGELEHALRAASIGELTGSIAHEVNQPLSALMSYAHAGRRWLRREPPNVEEARSALDEVLNAAQRASEVVARVRKLMGKAEPDRLPVAIDPLARDTARLIEAQAEAQGVAVELDLNAPGCEVSGDRVLLQQMLLNLLGNAIHALEATTPDTRSLFLSTRTTPEAVVLEVEDTGPGFTEEAMERAFQSFFTTKAKGMGLGLSISRSTVEAHGGSLTVAKGPRAGGALLRVTLPPVVAGSVERTED